MNDLFRLDGRTAIVTGGASGLGLGIAKALGERGASLVVADINSDNLILAEHELVNLGYKVAPSYCDVTKEETFINTLKLAEERFGGADILVNNAGVTRMQEFFDVQISDFQLIYDVNVISLFNCTKYFAEDLIKRGKGGSIVNISSNGAKVTYKDQIHYCSSKAAVANMTQNMADIFAEYGINANAICPGAVDTSMLRDCMVATEEQTKGAVTVEDCVKTWGPAQIGRLIEPEEVGRIVAFLCSEAGAMIRGQSINVDAGNTRF